MSDGDRDKVVQMPRLTGGLAGGNPDDDWKDEMLDNALEANQRLADENMQLRQELRRQQPMQQPMQQQIERPVDQPASRPVTGWAAFRRFVLIAVTTFVVLILVTMLIGVLANGT